MRTIKLLLVAVMCLFASQSFAQNITVKGTVTDAQTGEPIPYASVVVKGTSVWAITSADGGFSIEAPGNATLSVDLLGYTKAEVAVDGRTSLAIKLAPEYDALSESVVIGYGVQQKKLVTGSTVQVKGDALTKLSTTSALGALQSQSPGVAITQNSGQPGQGFKVNIRGIGTIGDSAPLYVIDGVAGGDINALNPSDIESIDVLKDAASAAIYGARAANGVILITTKQGSEGRTIVSYDGYAGAQYIAKMPDLCNAQEYIMLQDMSRTNSGSPLYDWENLLPAALLKSVKDGSWTGSDWLNGMYNKGAKVTNHAVNVTGGTADHQFSMGVSYTGQDGILGYNEIRPVYSQYKRYTFRLNSDHAVIKSNAGDFTILRIGETLNFSTGQNNGLPEGDIYDNSLHYALGANPLLPIYTRDDAGNITGFYDEAARQADGWNFDGSARNCIGEDYYDRGNNLTKNYNLHTSAYVELQPVKDLKFKSQFGYKLSSTSSRAYTMKYMLSSGRYTDYDSVSQGMSVRERFTWENTASYHFSVADNNVFDVVLGQSVEKWGMGESLSTTSANSIFQNDFERAYISNTKPELLNQIGLSGAPGTRGALASFFGRVNYSLKDTYLFSATLRADGSSNFARGHRWGYFPSVSAGWIMTNEPWMKNVTPVMNFFKLRASWGQNGNASIDNFQYLSTISLSNSAAYYFANKAVPTTGAIPDILANPNVSWETSEQFDLGFDARFFDSSLGLTFDAYVKNTKDWLVTAPIASVYGLASPYVNGGDVRNSGVEAALDYNKRIGEFSFGFNLNGSYNKNIVTRIANAEGIIHGEDDVLSQGTSEMYRVQEGYPIGYFYGYKTAGVFQNQAQIDATPVKYADSKPGDLIFVNTNSDNDITEDDRTMIGDPHPDFTAGLNLWASWKGFDFSIAGYGAFGHQIAKSYRSFFDCPRENFTRDFLNCWNGEGTSNKYPTLTLCNDRNWSNISDIYIENADFFKISNVTLGYDFNRIFKASFLSKARLYLTAQNLLTITKYSGMDPEIGYGFGEDWVSGIDLGYYPSARTFLVGVNIQF